MPLQAQNVSVTLPVSQAIEQVKRVLFNPFDLGKWFTIGFCAWLAHLGQQGFRGNFGSGGRGGNFKPQDWARRAHDYFTANMYWIIPLAIALAIALVVLWVLILWLSSRGKFMFLHCVVRNVAEVVSPWHRYAREGMTLFWFRLVLGLGQVVVIVPLLGLVGVLVWRMVQQGAPSAAGIVGAIVVGLVFVLVCLAAWVIVRLTNDFVVPILFLRGGSCTEAWRVLGQLLSVNLGGFILYFLFQILLSLAITACVVALVLVTCCVAGCLLALPYLGTVLFLPVLMFQRAYSVLYLRQYGPEFDVFAALPPSGSPAV
jgi:hypothetical protein